MAVSDKYGGLLGVLTMSRFYSELITWSTVAMTGGAVILNDIDLPPPGVEPDKPAAMVAAETEEYPDALAPERTGGPYADIRQAELEEVTFTATGDAPAAVTTDAGPTGRVTAAALNLRAGPGTNFAIVSRATEGQRLPLTGGRDGIWVEVELPGAGGAAWAHGRYVDAPDF